MVTESRAEDADDRAEDMGEQIDADVNGAGEGDNADATCDHSSACYDLADFYDRTDRIPKDTGFYSEDLVKRYIRSITVKAKWLVVKFKAGVEIKVKT